jgi:hypothetical protein
LQNRDTKTQIVVAADGLSKRDVFRLPDPFAVITVDAEQTHTTSVMKKTLNPYWNESFDMYVMLFKFPHSPLINIAITVAQSRTPRLSPSRSSISASSSEEIRAFSVSLMSGLVMYSTLSLVAMVREKFIYSYHALTAFSCRNAHLGPEEIE